MTEKIAIFGGTFDPVHRGHVHAAIALVSELALDRIYFVPAYQTVHRDQPQATTEQRLAMLSLALENHSRLLLDDREVVRGGPSYSLLTLQEYRQQYPQAALYFILGVDAFNTIERWYQWQQLIQYVNLVVLSRPGYRLMNSYHDTLGIEARPITTENLTLPSLSGEIYLSEQQMLDQSATEVREAIKSDRPVLQMLPDNVANYIKEHNIYGKDLLK